MSNSACFSMTRQPRNVFLSGRIGIISGTAAFNLIRYRLNMGQIGGGQPVGIQVPHHFSFNGDFDVMCRNPNSYNHVVNPYAEMYVGESEGESGGTTISQTRYELKIRSGTYGLSCRGNVDYMLEMVWDTGWFEPYVGWHSSTATLNKHISSIGLTANPASLAQNPNWSYSGTVPDGEFTYRIPPEEISLSSPTVVPMTGAYAYAGVVFDNALVPKTLFYPKAQTMGYGWYFDRINWNVWNTIFPLEIEISNDRYQTSTYLETPDDSDSLPGDTIKGNRFQLTGGVNLQIISGDPGAAGALASVPMGYGVNSKRIVDHFNPTADFDIAGGHTLHLELDQSKTIW